MAEHLDDRDERLAHRALAHAGCRHSRGADFHRDDHFIQDQQPYVAIHAIQAVVRAVRNHAQLPPCRRLFTGPDVRCLS